MSIYNQKIIFSIFATPSHPFGKGPEADAFFSAVGGGAGGGGQHRFAAVHIPQDSVGLRRSIVPETSKGTAEGHSGRVASFQRYLPLHDSLDLFRCAEVVPQYAATFPALRIRRAFNIDEPKNLSG